MTKKITGALLIAIPGRILDYVKANSQKDLSYYSVYFWLDDDLAIYIHGNTQYGKSSGNYQGRSADQIGTQYFLGLESVLEGDSLLDAMNRVQSIQIDSNECPWSGTMDELLDLIGLADKE